MPSLSSNRRRRFLKWMISLCWLAQHISASQAAFAGLAQRRHPGGAAQKPSLPLHPTPATTRTTTQVAPTSSLSSNDANNAAVEPVDGWRGQLLKASNFASLLCVLDCTALPIVTVILPLFGLVAASPAQMEVLHQLGHQVALFFVLPVGGSATLLNYLYAHRQKSIAALGICGLLLVAMANAPHSVLHAVHHGVFRALYPLLHFVHGGITHRVTNILGCACLLGSNYWSKKSGKCLHGHDHSDCSDHNGGASSSSSSSSHSHD